MSDLLEIIDKMKKISNVKSDKEVAKLLKTKADTLSQWKTRNKIPFKELLEYSNIQNISLNWLLTGKGEMYLTDKTHKNINSNIITGGQINGDINMSVNMAQFNHTEDIKEIIELLKYAPSGFLSIIKNKLIQFKELSQL